MILFSARASWGQDPTNTQNYNRYGYVLNNPLKYTDPSGEMGEYPGTGKECIGCGYNSQSDIRENNWNNTQYGNGLVQSIYDFLNDPANKEWISKNLSARSFDKAGTEFANGFKDGVNFVTGNIRSAWGDVKSFFGGGGGSSGPPPNTATNVNLNPYTGGGFNNSFDINNKSFNEYKGVFNAGIAKVSMATGVVQHVAQNQIISNYKAGGNVLDAMKDFKSLGALRKVNKVFQKVGVAGWAIDALQLSDKMYDNKAHTSDYLRFGISTALTFVAVTNPVGLVAIGAYGAFDYYYGNEFWKKTGVDNY